MAVSQLSPQERADKLLGEAINLASNDRKGDAALKVEAARDALDTESDEVWRYLQLAKTADGWEFCNYLEQARIALGADE